MAFPIKPKRRSGASGNPTTLELGELAVNTLDGELYLGGDGGVMLLNGPVAAGTTPTVFTGDGSTVEFTPINGYTSTNAGAYLVSVGGLDQRPTTDYTITATAGGTITFATAPRNGEPIVVRAIQAGGGGSGAGLTTNAPAALATAPVVGLATEAARADHQHQFPTAAQVGALAVNASAGGDLAGNYPSPTLAAVTTAQSNVGSGIVIPRLSIDAKGRVTALSTVAVAALTTNEIAGLTTSLPAALAESAVVGVSAYAARSDHQHTLAAITTAQSNVGSSTVIPVISIDATGRVSSLTTAQASAATGFTVTALQTQSLTIDATFAQKIVPFGVDTGVIVTLPADVNASITPGAEIKFTTNGTGEVTFAAGVGATLLASQNYTAIATQYASATATKLFANTWILSGNTTLSSYVDPYYSSVSLLLHMNGANNGTSFPDNSANNYTVTPLGGAVTSTAQFKFGTASYLGGSGRYLTVSTDNTPFAFGTADFTLEFWVRPSAFSAQQNLIVFSNIASSAIIISTAGVCSYQLSGTNRLSSSALALNTWAHIAISRVSGVSRMFVNGTFQGATYTDTTNYLSTGTLWQIGGAGSPLIGNLDDLRVTKGVGRYVTSFTAPIAEFPNS